MGMAWDSESLDGEVGGDDGSQDGLDHEDEQEKEEVRDQELIHKVQDYL